MARSTPPPKGNSKLSLLKFQSGKNSREKFPLVSDAACLFQKQGCVLV